MAVSPSELELGMAVLGKASSSLPDRLGLPRTSCLTFYLYYLTINFYESYFSEDGSNQVLRNIGACHIPGHCNQL
jgi:hypothetical protein